MNQLRTLTSEELSQVEGGCLLCFLGGLVVGLVVGWIVGHTGGDLSVTFGGGGGGTDSGGSALMLN